MFCVFRTITNLRLNTSSPQDKASLPTCLGLKDNVSLSPGKAYRDPLCYFYPLVCLHYITVKLKSSVPKSESAICQMQ